MRSDYLDTKHLFNERVIKWLEELGFKKIKGDPKQTYEDFIFEKNGKKIRVQITRKYIKIVNRNGFPKVVIDNTKTALRMNINKFNSNLC